MRQSNRRHERSLSSIVHRRTSREHNEEDGGHAAAGIVIIRPRNECTIETKTNSIVATSVRLSIAAYRYELDC